MKLVIDIPEKLNNKSFAYLTEEEKQTILNAVDSGFPLPKGYDALIDRKNVIDVIDWYRLNPQHFSIDNVIDDIKCMEFLVEADKEGAEE